MSEERWRRSGPSPRSVQSIPEERRKPVRALVVGGIVVAVLVAFVAVLVVVDVRQGGGGELPSEPPSEPPSGVKEFEVPTRDHTEG